MNIKLKALIEKNIRILVSVKTTNMARTEVIKIQVLVRISIKATMMPIIKAVK
jgi:hypothetical protein